MNRSLLLFSLLGSIFCFAQSELIFEYDASGNQIYRGSVSSTSTTPKKSSSSISSGMSLAELAFWRKVSVSPNPTSDILLIQFNEEIKKDLLKIELYSHSSLGRFVHSTSISSASGLSLILNMRAYIVGVYILSFYLRDGKVFSKHILKQ